MVPLADIFNHKAAVVHLGEGCGLLTGIWLPAVVPVCTHLHHITCQAGCAACLAAHPATRTLLPRLHGAPHCRWQLRAGASLPRGPRRGELPG